MNNRSLISVKDLTKDEIVHILEDALLFDDSMKDWQLPCKKALVANLFYEPSTRTHYSFESAEYQLGCKVADVDIAHSSVNKGETLYDTVKTLEMHGYDAFVIRHSDNEYYKELENINVPILNAGAGSSEHPTQCLLDLLTIYKEFGTLQGLNVVVCGDILHSRVASSIKDALHRFGTEVKFTGPEIWEREGFETIDFDEAIPNADVVMMLRIQKERGAEFLDNYLEEYGLNKQRYERMKDTAIVMHPAPFNRNVEIDGDLVEASKSRIFPQMANGVLVRKAVLKRAFGYDTFEEVGK